MKKSIFTRILAIALVAMSIMAVAIPAMAADVVRYVNVTPNLNFRETPNGDLIDRIPYGASVVQHSVSTVSGTKWSYITYNSVNGYVMTKYLTDTAVTTHPQNSTQAFGSYTLQQGQTSYYVKNLQLALKHGGYMTGSADGIFGSQTYNAVIAFQTAKGLTADGLVGPATRAKLWSLYGTWLQSNGVMAL